MVAGWTDCGWGRCRCCSVDGYQWRSRSFFNHPLWSLPVLGRDESCQIVTFPVGMLSQGRRATYTVIFKVRSAERREGWRVTNQQAGGTAEGTRLCRRSSRSWKGSGEPSTGWGRRGGALLKCQVGHSKTKSELCSPHFYHKLLEIRPLTYEMWQTCLINRQLKLLIVIGVRLKQSFNW